MTVCAGAGPNASCSGWLDELSDGFVGPWSDTFQRLSATRFDWWFGLYVKAGGTLDWLFSDFESDPGPADLQWSNMRRQSNGSGAVGAEHAIMADTRFASLRLQLMAAADAGGCNWNGSIEGWRNWEPTDCRVQSWNAIMYNMTAEAMNGAVFRSARRVFPLIKTSDFTHHHEDPLNTGTWGCVNIVELNRAIAIIPTAA